jgi:hypothetical protein
VTAIGRPERWWNKAGRLGACPAKGAKVVDPTSGLLSKHNFEFADPMLRFQVDSLPRTSPVVLVLS